MAAGWKAERRRSGKKKGQRVASQAALCPSRGGRVKISSSFTNADEVTRAGARGLGTIHLKILF